MATDIEEAVVRKSSIISASRRTDIPAFYMSMMMDALSRGFIDVRTRGAVSRVSLAPGDVKCIVWWSKNYAHWLALWANPSSRAILSRYGHMFNFTLNGSLSLEPGVAATLQERFAQLETLAREFGPRAIKLRFDPIVVYKHAGERQTNLENFEVIVRHAASVGIRAIIFAFYINYAKVERRMLARGLTPVVLSVSEQKSILDILLPICASHGVQLQSCCNSALTGYRGIVASQCIDGPTINDIYHAGLTVKKDAGQRDECNCAQSRDIGSYEMKCGHNCIYCYANTQK